MGTELLLALGLPIAYLLITTAWLLLLPALSLAVMVTL